MVLGKAAWRQTLGLGILFAWMYCSFFSCGLVPNPSVLRSVEHVWVFAAAAMAVTAAIILMLHKRHPVTSSPFAGVVAAAASSIGSILFWLSFLDYTWNMPLSAVGGALCGIGLTMQAVIWGQRLSGMDAERLEKIVPLAYVFAFAAYFILLAIKRYLFVIACAIMPPVCMYLAFRDGESKADRPSHTKEASLVSGKIMVKRLAGMTPLFVLFALMWFQFASFRVISSPDAVGDRIMHYLMPFSCAFVVAMALFWFCMRHSRFLNYSLMYRWAVPLMVLGCGVLFLGPTAFYDYKSVAYAANFVAMFGVQFTLWMVTPKHARRRGLNTAPVFCGFLIAEGVGIAAGLVFSLPAAGHEESAMAASLLITGIVACVAMIVGFNQNWFLSSRFVLTPQDAEDLDSAEFAGAAGTADEATEKASTEKPLQNAIDAANEPDANDSDFQEDLEGRTAIAGLLGKRAQSLGAEYGLTEREIEICALLLAGRSRPFIRDELIVSLNTVHAHTRNIYAKCGVHSQQELMSLMAPKENEVPRKD